MLATTSQNGTPTDTIYFDGYTETSLSGGTTTTTKYYSINGQRLAEKVNGTLTYLVTDLLSNVVLAINASGTVVAVELYEPYGTLNYSWGTMPTSHNYTDQRLDSQSGLLYYNFRWYDPVTGQFVRTDTKQNNTNGFDPYAYVSDNPETKNDPTGHWGWGTIALIVAVVVVVAVVAVVAAPVLIAAAGATAEVAADGAVVGGIAEGTADVAGAATADATATTAADATIDAAADTTADAVGDTAGDVSADASTDTSADASSDTSNDGGNGCDALSFRASTLVATAQGEHPISTLHVGEKVWSYNPQAKKMELEPIQKVWLNHDTDLVDLTLVATVKDAHGKTSEQKEVVHTNEKHPFLTKEKGFIPVSQLKPGMHVLEADGSYGVVAQLVVVPDAMWMYNLTVAQDHTYVVGIEQWIVHNCDNGFSNKMPQNLNGELNGAKNLGVQPMSASDPGFSNMVNQGPVKWAVNQAGDLRFVPKFVNGTEIFHSVLTAGAPVLAAGEADIVAAGDEYWVTDINNYSGHFQPDLDSLENIAKPLFRALGFFGL